MARCQPIEGYEGNLPVQTQMQSVRAPGPLNGALDVPTDSHHLCRFVPRSGCSGLLQTPRQSWDLFRIRLARIPMTYRVRHMRSQLTCKDHFYNAILPCLWSPTDLRPWLQHCGAIKLAWYLLCNLHPPAQYPYVPPPPSLRLKRKKNRETDLKESKRGSSLAYREVVSLPF
jgi:hypothetical protein